jgi:hypothetical protein
VEIRDYQIHICQGEQTGRVGFVQRGQAVEMVSRQAVFHSLQARGADFFARALPQPDLACAPVLNRPGAVELRSGAGHFWMRGYLFVADHPYFACTDSKGRFRLTGVPPGKYELVCWMPSWKEAEHELDADTVLLTQLVFQPPVEKVRPVELAAGQSCSVAVQLSMTDFPSAQREPISRCPQIPRVP